MSLKFKFPVVAEEKYPQTKLLHHHALQWIYPFCSFVSKMVWLYTYTNK